MGIRYDNFAFIICLSKLYMLVSLALHCFMLSIFIFQAVMMTSLTFIVLSVLSLCFHSMLRQEIIENHNNTTWELPAAHFHISYPLLTLDVISCIIFTLELLLRFISCPDRIKFMKQTINWIDFLSLIPYYATFAEYPYGRLKVISTWIEYLSIVRLLRLFRFFKMSTGLQILKQTLIASSGELFFFMLLLMIPVAIFATVLHFCERSVSASLFHKCFLFFWPRFRKGEGP